MSDKILIADDEPSNRKILEQELVHKGFAVDTACGGKEALAKIESAPPDLVILDYMMPDLSGLEVLKETSQQRQRHAGDHDNRLRLRRARRRGHEGWGLRFHHQAFRS